MQLLSFLLPFRLQPHPHAPALLLSSSLLYCAHLTPSSALGFPTVLIPWVVLQELDAMKNGKLTSAVERRATPAVNYIYSCLKSQEPRLWGQSMQQASLALCELHQCVCQLVTQYLCVLVCVFVGLLDPCVPSMSSHNQLVSSHCSLVPF